MRCTPVAVGHYNSKTIKINYSNTNETRQKKRDSFYYFTQQTKFDGRMKYARKRKRDKTCKQQLKNHKFPENTEKVTLKNKVKKVTPKKKHAHKNYIAFNCYTRNVNR